MFNTNKAGTTKSETTTTTTSSAKQQQRKNLKTGSKSLKNKVYKGHNTITTTSKK